MGREIEWDICTQHNVGYIWLLKMPPVTCSYVHETGGHHVKWNKPGTRREIPHIFIHTKSIKSWLCKIKE